MGREYRLRSSDYEHQRRDVDRRAQTPALEPRVGKRTGLDSVRANSDAIGKHTLGFDSRYDEQNAQLVESYVARARQVMARLVASNRAKDARASASAAREVARLVSEAESCVAAVGHDVESLAASVVKLAHEVAPHISEAFKPSAPADVHVPGIRNTAFDREAASWAERDG
jgi:hypothetical protein